MYICINRNKHVYDARNSSRNLTEARRFRYPFLFIFFSEVKFQKYADRD